jgi:hypothetical protein
MKIIWFAHPNLNQTTVQTTFYYGSAYETNSDPAKRAKTSCYVNTVRECFSAVHAYSPTCFRMNRAQFALLFPSIHQHNYTQIQNSLRKANK